MDAERQYEWPPGPRRRGLGPSRGVLPVLLMDAEWHDYREGGYLLGQPETRNRRIVAGVEGFIFLSQHTSKRTCMAERG